MTSGQFLQSKEWETFQESLGRKTFRVEDTLVIKMPFALGFSFLYSPKGECTNLNEIKKIAKKEKAFFYRIEPQEKPGKPFFQFRDKEPKCTQILDLSKSENELLAEMKQKTRYNINLARRKEIKIKNQEFEKFYNLLLQTSERQKIKLHSKNYYQKLVEFNEIFIAYYNDEPIAGAMVNFYKDTATYLHGGSSDKHKEVMAPYLLHWEIIKTAKARGIKYYDWWGVDEEKWPGITKFKQGFSGKEICAPGTFDLPIDKFLYFWYKFIRK
ncbi:peptidoglycan bridge formation glycyltransferase FemA/FemB family protein [Patescibacteria group bacterium]|nr:peptidoglycan bridge formation glycyltransferase FemA/FemB family protein [Patescibacteria group bacterium]